MRAQRRKVALRVVRKAAAVCLGYPERDVINTAVLIRAALAEKAGWHAEAFEPLLAYWESSDLAAIQTNYVDVFDLSRKHSLYLSYWRVGTITGIVGACGGLGGFFPPLVMGATYNEAAHSYTLGLVLLTITASGALLFTLFGIRRKAPATS